MKKFLAIVAVALMAATNTFAFNAKTIGGVLVKNPVQVQNIQSIGPRKALAANQQYMGAYTSDTYASESDGLGLTGYPGTYSIVASLPLSILSAYDGGKVVGMRFAMAVPANTSKCFIINYKSDYTLDTLAVAKVTSSKAGWNEVTFTKPFTLNLSEIGELLMGFDYVQTSSNYPISVVNEGTICNTYLYGDLGDGTGFYNVGLSSYGNLSVQAIVEKDWAKTGVSASDFEDCHVQIGKTCDATLTLTNCGTDGVESIGYTVTRRGKTSEEKTLAVSPKVTTFSGQFTVSIPLEAASEVSSDDVSVTITKVNGKENTIAGNVATGKVITVSKLYTKRVAIEEFTGTGCGWCPRGLMGMKLLRENYGDKFVGIGLHWYNSSDYMYLDKNKYASVSFSGAPSCRINRGEETDPYYGSTKSDRGVFTEFDAALKEFAPVGVDITGHYDKNFGATVTATATIESENDAEYKVEFVVIADSVYNALKKQSNYYYMYSGSQVGSDLSIFAGDGEYGTSTFAWAFDDVAVASSYSNGANGLSDISLKGNVPQEITYTMTMPEASTVLAKAMDYGKVSVVALVIDKTTGKIVNCAKSAYLDKSGLTGESSFCDADGNYTVELTKVTAMNGDQKMNSQVFGIRNYGKTEVTKTISLTATALPSGSYVFGTADNNVVVSAAGEKKEITFTIPAESKVIFDATGWMPERGKTGTAAVAITLDGQTITDSYTYSKTSYPLAFCKRNNSSTSVASFDFSNTFKTEADGKIAMQNYGVKNQNLTSSYVGTVTATAKSLPSGRFYFTVEGTPCVLEAEGATAQATVNLTKSAYELFTDAYWQPADNTPASSAVIVFTTGDKVFTATFEYAGATAISTVNADVNDRVKCSKNIKNGRIVITKGSREYTFGGALLK